MREIVYYKIAGIGIKVTSDLDFPLNYGDLEEFRSTDQQYDYEVEFQKTTNINEFMSADFVRVLTIPWCHVYLDPKENLEYHFYVDQGVYFAVSIAYEKKTCVYYLTSGWVLDLIKGGYKLYNFMSMEHFFSQYNRFILHSCHICMNDTSILFTAPSGTGKSTQGNLWKEYKGARVINGDRTALAKTEKGWRAYGVPMCGSSGIHLNEEHKLGSIIVIRQGKEDKLVNVSKMELLRCLYGEMNICDWNRQCVNQALDFLNDLLKEIPVYMYECTMEETAVSTMYSILSKEGVL